MLWFDIFMAVIMLLIPGTMLFFGCYWKKHPPADINSLYGYRSRRSMFNRATWDYAHQVAAVVWWKLGWGTLIVTLLLTIVLLVGDWTVEFVGKVGGIVTFAQCVPMLVVIPVTERSLKKHFGI